MMIDKSSNFIFLYGILILKGMHKVIYYPLEVYNKNIIV